MKKFLIGPLLAAVTLMLAACGGPSDSDVVDAVREAFRQRVAESLEIQNGLAGAFGNRQAGRKADAQASKVLEAIDAMIIIVQSVEETDDGTYEAHVLVGGEGEKGREQMVILKDGDDGWEAQLPVTIPWG